MPPQRIKEAESAFRLDKKILHPLLLLLLMPLLAVARALMLHGFNARNLVSLGLTALMAALFLPWLTRKVSVSPSGIRSSMLLARGSLSWDEVRKVSGYSFRGRAVVLVEGGGRRLAVTDSLANFRHLVAYIIEHSSGAAIDPDIAPLLLSPGRAARDGAVLWTAAALMAMLLAVRLLY